MSILASVSSLGKVTPRQLKILSKMGILTVQDLLKFYPRRYLDFSKFTEIKNITLGETVTILVTVKSIQSKLLWTTKRNMAEAVVADETGTLKVLWFNQGYIAKQLKAGDKVYLAGKVELYNKTLQMTNPIHELVSEHPLHTGRLVPIYSLPEGLYNRTFRNLIAKALPLSEQLTDDIPVQVLQKNILPNIAKTTQELHFPTQIENVRKAQERLAFEEALVEQLAVQTYKLWLQENSAPNVSPDIENIKKWLKLLPFELTQAQKKVLWEICLDLEKKHPMNRLVMGDVGSGKTIVAILTALQIIKAKFQVVLLAPTEILSKQHFDGLLSSPLFNKFKTLKVGLLTRSFQSVNGETVTKKELLNKVKTGTINLLIGTHALLESSVTFKNLALAIIDEQHRFGVNQRHAILEKLNKQDGQASWTPHLLSMTATPIPRTVALNLYGDLEVSVLNELPQNRLPIKTWVVPEHKRLGAYAFIKQEILQGRQAFLITPLVEESDKLQVKSVKAEFERLQRTVFKDFKLGLIYGGLKGEVKDAEMLKFKNRETDILVATSVIEIGIDIPNATVMVIEGAERFGLAQLHQLRGRVGRGQYQSYCLLFISEKNDSSTAYTNELPLLTNPPSTDLKAEKQDRLTFFAETRDGFKLAEYDLEARGFGSLFGTKQTGFNFKYGEFLTLKVLKSAKASAQNLLEEDATLNSIPALKKRALPLVDHVHLE